MLQGCRFCDSSVDNLVEDVDEKTKPMGTFMFKGSITYAIEFTCGGVITHLYVSFQREAGSVFLLMYNG